MKLNRGVQFAAALTLACVLGGEFALGGVGSVQPAPNEAMPSWIIQVQSKNKEGRRKGTGKGKDAAEKCREACSTKKNPATCQALCSVKRKKGK